MFNVKYRLMDEANIDGGEGGGGSEVIEQKPSIDELMATVAQLTESNGKMKGHMNDLLGEKKAEKEKREVAEQAAQQKELEASKNAGDMAKFEEQINEQFAGKETGYQSKIEELNNVILGGKKTEIITELANMFQSPAAAKLMLNSMVKTQYGDNHSVLPEFKGLDGQLVTTDLKSFVEYIKGNEAFASMLTGVNSSGGHDDGSIITTASGSNFDSKTKQNESPDEERARKINEKFKKL